MTNCEGTEEGRPKKGRHRKKCQRRKNNPLNDDHLKVLCNLNTDEKFWDVMTVPEIMGKSKGPNLTNAVCSRWLSAGNNIHSLLEELFSPQCVHILCEVNAPILNRANAKLRQLMPRIGRIRMRRILNDHIPTHKRRKCAYLISHPLERRQLYSFVAKLFALLFRDELLDNFNMEKLCENISCTFINLRNRGFLISRSQISKGVRFDRILWLNGLHFQLKKSIVLNMLKSFLNLFVQIFASFFYSTLNYAGQIVHYRRDIWCHICAEGFDLLRAERKMKLFLSNGHHSVFDNETIHKLIFLPKKRTVRPIVVLRNAKFKNKLNDIRAVLRFLLRQFPSLYGWGISSIRLFGFAYRRLTLQQIHRHPQRGRRMHFCAADLHNCYTSLEHSVLDRILQKIIPPKSKFVVVSVQVTNKVYKYRKTKTEAGLSFVDAFSRLRCKGSEEITSSPLECCISGAELIQMIRQFAIQTMIREPFCAINSHLAPREGQLRQRLFVCGRGIGQGNSLSVALCNLYLGWVEREIYRVRPNVFCRRYMDDYLMIADQKEQIEQLIATLMCEMPKFGLCFGKLTTSFRSQDNQIQTLKSKDKVQWCGLAINHRTLSMTVDYRRYRRNRPSLSLPSVALCASEQYHFVCNIVKRALSSRMVLLRSCARVWSSKRRAVLLRGFCQFAHSYYIRHILKCFSLDPKDVFVRDFLCQLSKYIWNGFRKRSLPTQMASSSVFKESIAVFQT